MRRLVITGWLVIALVPSARAESVLRTMITTDIRGLMPGNTAAPDARQPLVDELHRLFVDDAPMIVWSSGVNISAFSPVVHGYAPWRGRKPRFWNVEVAR